MIDLIYGFGNGLLAAGWWWFRSIRLRTGSPRHSWRIAPARANAERHDMNDSPSARGPAAATLPALEQTDAFVPRHIGPAPQDQAAMPEGLGQQNFAAGALRASIAHRMSLLNRIAGAMLAILALRMVSG